ncbi:TRAP transporter permease [Microbulbifer sp. S227A]|uniref:TRAP transporter permease n=1 Tax=Microbulbifer sp. S227A TaxID=3415131 RepID=UPI003C7B3E6E
MSLRLSGIRSILASVTGIFYVLLMIKQFFVPDAPMLIIPFHVFVTLGLVYLFIPFKYKGKTPLLSHIFDLAAYAFCLFLAYYYWQNVERNQLRFESIDPVYIGEVLAFWVGLPLLLEGVRRTTGWGLVCVLGAFLAYGTGFMDMPGWLNFPGFSHSDYVEITMLGTEGVFGVAANAMVSMVFYFVLFGAIFSATGGGNVFIDLALLASGRFVGGAAKSAIVASSLFGTVSGAAVANVTSTGVLTIPLMKRTGYTPEQAAATEAVASTGGQLMPPIMGVAAFVMADLLGVPYVTIALAGIIPALGYYVALFVSVDLLARKANIGSISYVDLKENMHPLRPRAHLLIAPLVIVLGLFSGYSVSLSALSGTAAAVLLPFLRKSTRYHVKDIITMVVDCAKQMAVISVAVSAVGVIIAVSIQSGVAIKFVTLLADVGSGNLLLSLFLVILGCLTLGMGLPTVAAYIISAVIFVPALGRLGVDPLAAHFFVLYYSVLSMITPPVCLAAFAGAGIAKADANKTGLLALSLAMVIFVLPFGFVRDMALLGQGSKGTILAACFGILCATTSWAIALQGWLGVRLKLLQRAMFIVLCIVIIYEPTMSIMWLAAVVIFVALCGLLIYRGKGSFGPKRISAVDPPS